MQEHELDLTEIDDEQLNRFLRDLLLYLIEEKGFDYAQDVACNILDYVIDCRIAKSRMQ